jgi:peptidoglycan/LPS O-acetylase OafA/YrhL
VSHSFALGGFGETPQTVELGGWAVNGFFGISGYLILSSRQRSDIASFLWRRFLRILPAFWVVLIVTGFILAPTSSLLTGQRWNPLDSAAYVATNLALVSGIGSIGSTLNGAPVPATWNNPLWTLQWEFLCYIVVAVLLIVPLIRRYVVPTCVVWYLAVTVLQRSIFAHWNEMGGPLGGSLVSFARLMSFFAAGMLLAALRKYVPAKGWIAILCFGAFLGLYMRGGAELYVQLPFTYLLLWLGSSIPIHVGSVNDVSYGVYIYGFPMQQLLWCCGATRWGWLPYLIASLVAALACGWVSWVLVERPVMRLRCLVPVRIGGEARLHAEQPGVSKHRSLS